VAANVLRTEGGGFDGGALAQGSRRRVWWRRLVTPHVLSAAGGVLMVAHLLRAAKRRSLCGAVAIGRFRFPCFSVSVRKCHE
jgi:hypothetical protein